MSTNIRRYQLYTFLTHFRMTHISRTEVPLKDSNFTRCDHLSFVLFYIVMIKSLLIDIKKIVYCFTTTLDVISRILTLRLVFLYFCQWKKERSQITLHKTSFLVLVFFFTHLKPWVFKKSNEETRSFLS